MKIRLMIVLVCVVPLLALSVWGSEKPADIYFGLAVTENSFSHYGDNLLFLDFQEQVDTDVISDRVVIAPRIKSGSIRMDGSGEDWNPTYLTKIHARVMNNYPLSRHYDAIAGDILIGSAYDDRYIYFLVQYEDANHDASLNRERWVFNGSKWERMEHVKPRADTPAARAANAKEAVRGRENEDRVFFMFPIIDRQRNFRSNGLGCAMYCHSNLKRSGDPKEKWIGEGVAGMHTIVPGDVADLWRWEAATTRPLDTLKDGYLSYGEGLGVSGVRMDRGTGHEMINDRPHLEISKNSGPVFINQLDLLAGRYGKQGFVSETLPMELAAPIAAGMKFAKGDSIPYTVARTPSGSRGDVTAVGRFDAETSRWTVEFRRALNTGDATDHQFVPGKDAAPPDNPIAIRGDGERGEVLYVNKGCDTCHGEKGEGKFVARRWVFPRIQRVSGALISKTVKFNQEMRGTVASLIRREIRKETKLVMPDIDISPQEAEDIASWLQTLFTPTDGT